LLRSQFVFFGSARPPCGRNEPDVCQPKQPSQEDGHDQITPSSLSGLASCFRRIAPRFLRKGEEYHFTVAAWFFLVNYQYTAGFGGNPSFAIWLPGTRRASESSTCSHCRARGRSKIGDKTYDVLLTGDNIRGDVFKHDFSIGLSPMQTRTPTGRQTRTLDGHSLQVRLQLRHYARQNAQHVPFGGAEG